MLARKKRKDIEIFSTFNRCIILKGSRLESDFFFNLKFNDYG